MKQIQTEIIIQSPIKKVWEVLIDFDKHSYWNPFIKSILGEKEVGEKLQVIMRVPGMNKMTFKPKVLVFDKEKEFRWKGQLFVPGLFDGEHYFLLRKIDETTTKFIHGELFSGILLGMFNRILNKTRLGFEMMNKSLKLICEKNKGLRELERNLNNK
jgi:hypothetical protein